MAEVALQGDTLVTPAIVAELIADGVKPLEDALRRMEDLLSALAARHTSNVQVPSERATFERRGFTKALPECGGLLSEPGNQERLQASTSSGTERNEGLVGSGEASSHKTVGQGSRPKSDVFERGASTISPTQQWNVRAIARGVTGDLVGEEQPKNLKQRALSIVRRRFAQIASGIKEPKRSGFLNKFVTSQLFESVSSSVIIINSIFIAYTTNLSMQSPGESRGTIVPAIEMFFVSFYTIELLLRIANFKLYFFVSADMAWNIFDFVVISLTLVDTGLRVLASADSGNSDVVITRMVRLLKLAKIMRTLRVMKVFRDLSIILESFKNCLMSLFWSVVMIFFSIYVFSLLFMQGLTGHIEDSVENRETSDHSNIIDKFGSLPASMLSLYMAVTGGNDWGVYYETVATAGNFYGAMFIFYTFFFAFALFNVLVAVFVEKAVVTAQPDREELILEQRRQIMQDVAEFRHICRVLDTDKTGTISRAEFHASMQNDLMLSYMSAVGLQIRDVDLFFDMVVSTTSKKGHNPDPWNVQVGIEEFVESCMSMKGVASSFDMQKHSLLMDFMNRSIEEFGVKSLKKMEQIAGCLDRVEELLRDDGAATGNKVCV